MSHDTFLYNVARLHLITSMDFWQNSTQFFGEEIVLQFRRQPSPSFCVFAMFLLLKGFGLNCGAIEIQFQASIFNFVFWCLLFQTQSHDIGL